MGECGGRSWEETFVDSRPFGWVPYVEDTEESGRESKKSFEDCKIEVLLFWVGGKG